MIKGTCQEVVKMWATGIKFKSLVEGQKSNLILISEHNESKGHAYQCYRNFRLVLLIWLAGRLRDGEGTKYN